MIFRSDRVHIFPVTRVGAAEVRRDFEMELRDLLLSGEWRASPAQGWIYGG